MYNEEPNVEPLCRELRKALDPTGLSYEVLLVNDGSSDGTAAEISRENAADARFMGIDQENQGQAKALTTGFRRSRGRIVASLDADLQNDPADLPALIADVEEGADVACGRRWPRQDSYLGKLLPSRIFNWLLRRLFGLRIHDVGCTLRAYRGEVARSLELDFADVSFITVLLHQRGLSVVERVVRHHPRHAGEAKYNSPARFRYTLRRMWQLWRK